MLKITKKKNHKNRVENFEKGYCLWTNVLFLPTNKNKSKNKIKYKKKKRKKKRDI